MPETPQGQQHPPHSKETAPERPAKRARLSLACTQCRKRKVKCDAEMPKCRNCRIRGHVCETTDPKNPELVVVRKWSGMRGPPDEDALYEEQHGNWTQPALEQQTIPTPLQSSRLSSTPRPSLREVETVGRHNFDVRSPQTASHPRPISWIARSYSDNMGDARANVDGVQDQPDIPASKGTSHESPDMALNTDGTKHRRKLMGGSSLQSLTMFLDIYLQRQGLAQIAPHFRFGMNHAEEFPLGLVLTLPDLPPPALMDTYLRTFFRRIHPIFPILDFGHFKEELSRLRALQDSHWSPENGSEGFKTHLKHSDIPSLASIYCVVSLGADETSGTVTEMGNSFLTAAYGLYAHLVALPYLPSVQALILLTLALRGRSKEGQGFQVLGQAIRIAHSVGLHRYIPGEEANDTENSNNYSRGADLHARVWWSAFSLEKLMELETARPSAIRNSDCDQVLPGNSKLASIDYFGHWVSLASILGHISDLLYRTKRHHQSALQLLQSVGELDRALTEWSNSLPEEIRPGNDLFCTLQDLHLATFLSIQYHQAMMTLHRAALAFPSQQYAKQIDTHVADLPWQLRLRKGLEICVASARSIVKLNVELAENRSILFVGTPPMLACVVLGLSIVKQPQSRMVRPDLELLISSSHFAEEEWRKGGQDEEFLKTCRVARESLMSFVEKHQSRGVNTINTLQSEISMLHQNTPDSMLSGNAQIAADWTQPGTHAILNPSRVDLFDEPFKDLALEDFWTFLGADSGLTGLSIDPLNGFET